MSKPANLKQGKLVAGKKLATKQEAAVVKSQKAFRKDSVNLLKNAAGFAIPLSPKKYIAGAKLVNKTIKTIRSK
jgi:hypothetical protein